MNLGAAHESLHAVAQSAVAYILAEEPEALKKGAWSAAVNAEVARGKAAGLYIEQKIIRTGKLEDLTTEELEQRMKKNNRRLLSDSRWGE